MFVAAFPLATVMSFVNNYIEMRVDAWKLCQITRRPEPRSAEDIGTWMVILQIMAVFAVMVNSGIIAFTGTYTQEHRWSVRVWIFITFTAGVLVYAPPPPPSLIPLSVSSPHSIFPSLVQIQHLALSLHS
jgi:hypothetical protein